MNNMAAVIREKGSPSVFTWENWPLPKLAPQDVLIRHGAIGVNFVDTYHRRGLPHPWPVPDPPLVLGFEAVGVIEAVGDDVVDFELGDRVGYAYPPHGAYAQWRCYPADRCVKIPQGIDDEEAAAVLFKGLTAHYLIRRTYVVKPGDTVLVHAASGGMGLILCQWCSIIGATVIGTVSNSEKAEIARANGCQYPIVRKDQNFLRAVKDITSGEGVSVVYESIGKDTFNESLDALRPMGVMASYGAASGPAPDVNMVDIGRRGSLFVTRPAIMHYLAKRGDLVAGADDLFDAILNRGLKASVGHRRPLREVAEAHRALEASQTTGSIVLLPFA
jgi:NADPH:quinone reductase-like Zn-dependent oxidoreductase